MGIKVGTKKVTGGEKQETKHDIEGGNNNKKLKLTKIDLLHSKPIREANKILEGHLPSTTKCTPKVQQRNDKKSHTKGAKGEGRVLLWKLLDNGQGKCDDDSEKDCASRSNMGISVESTTEAALQLTASDEFDLGKGQVLLRPPITHSTRKIDTGATKHLLRKQNKLLRNETLR